jgi:hypothetical protein
VCPGGHCAGRLGQSAGHNYQHDHDEHDHDEHDHDEHDHTSTTSSTPTPTNGAYAEASVVTCSGQSTLVAVATFNSLGQPANEPFSMAVVCGPCAGSGQTFPTNLP